MPWTFCPECETRIQVPRSVRLADQLECPECTSLLEVISLEPLELDLAYELEEDYEEEDWEEWGEDEDEDEALDFEEEEEEYDYEEEDYSEEER
jgi:alpha-aminoadipate/glutamate carrier protein LysW